MTKKIAILAKTRFWRIRSNNFHSRRGARGRIPAWLTSLFCTLNFRLLFLGVIVLKASGMLIAPTEDPNSVAYQIMHTDGLEVQSTDGGCLRWWGTICLPHYLTWLCIHLFASAGLERVVMQSVKLSTHGKPTNSLCFMGIRASRYWQENPDYEKHVLFKQCMISKRLNNAWLWVERPLRHSSWHSVGDVQHCQKLSLSLKSHLGKTIYTIHSSMPSHITPSPRCGLMLLRDALSVVSCRKE